jgi:hypothetical protein
MAAIVAAWRPVIRNGHGVRRRADGATSTAPSTSLAKSSTCSSPASRRDADRRFFQQAIGATKVTRVEVVTDKAAACPIVLDEVLLAVWDCTEQYANNHIECDHGR